MSLKNIIFLISASVRFVTAMEFEIPVAEEAPPTQHSESVGYARPLMMRIPIAMPWRGTGCFARLFRSWGFGVHAQLYRDCVLEGVRLKADDIVRIHEKFPQIKVLMLSETSPTELLKACAEKPALQSLRAFGATVPLHYVYLWANTSYDYYRFVDSLLTARHLARETSDSLDLTYLASTQP